VRKLTLEPLPPRPQDSAGNKPALETSDSPEKSTGPRDRYIAPEMKDWNRVYRSGHSLILPTTLNDSKDQTEKKLFIMDTGAFSTTISPEAAAEVSKFHPANHITIQGLGGKVQQVYSTDPITFNFGNIRQKSNEVYAFDMSNISKHMAWKWQASSASQR
jgi:hypothetical protein